MKTLLFIITICGFFSQNTLSQWNQQFSGTGANLDQVYFIDENIGFIIGIPTYNSTGAIRKTTNGGGSWSPVDLPYLNYVQPYSIQFINNTIGWLLCKNTNYSSMRLYKTIDSGQSWIIISNSIPMYYDNEIIRHVHFLTENDGFIVCQRTIYKTNDGGINWSRNTVPLTSNNHYSLIHAVKMFDSYTGYAVGWDATYHNAISWDIYGGVILITGDGGVSWNVVKNSNLLFEKIKFNGTNLGIAVGWDFSESKILKTTDSGLNWVDINLNFEEIRYCNDISFASGNSIFLVGQDKNSKGVVAKTTDGGNNWSYKHFDQVLNSVHFVNEKKGWATGQTGFLINYIKPEILSVSPTAGTIWQALSNYTINWSSINVQGNVAIKLSTNGGSTFPLTLNDNTANDNSEEISVPFNKSTSCRIRIESVDDPNVFGLNDGNFTITDPVDINDLTNSQPTEFALSQNFPNPFNPATIIYYSVPFESHVSIYLYNMLGEEIKILVNEIKTVGTYSVELVGDQIQSGVYLYKMQANEFSQIKKMVLVK